jgi:hypothetical protein
MFSRFRSYNYTLLQFPSLSRTRLQFRPWLCTCVPQIPHFCRHVVTKFYPRTCSKYFAPAWEIAFQIPSVYGIELFELCFCLRIRILKFRPFTDVLSKFFFSLRTCTQRIPPHFIDMRVPDSVIVYGNVLFKFSPSMQMSSQISPVYYCLLEIPLQFIDMRSLNSAPV